MTTLRIAVTALNQTPLDWDGNRERIVTAIERARATGAAFVCLPELCITGYGCEDAFQSPGTWATALDVLAEIAPATTGLCVSLGLPLFVRGALYNTAALVVDGRLRGFVAKQHLAGDGLHYEPRWFKPWPGGIRAGVEIEGAEQPVGDLLFDVGGVRVGFEICEDAWVHDRPGAALARRGVDVVLNPSASHFAFGKKAVRERFVLEGSRAFGVAYAYSNLLGKLTTSNRSEAAVGYATMDGDTAGGLAPIGGIDKAFLQTWLRWMETTGPAETGPIAALAAVNALTPTAELRPPARGQTDEDDLMPYPVLDAIEEAAIGRKLAPEAVFREVRRRFADAAAPQVLAWIERFYRLWARNQWKRERYAPAFHVDDRNLDPKTWCRFPILSGGFERELRALRERHARHDAIRSETP